MKIQMMAIAGGRLLARCALLGVMAMAPSTFATALVPMPAGLEITENFDAGTGRGSYAVYNGTAEHYLSGFGVSNSASIEASVGIYGEPLGCNLSWCYAATVLGAADWSSQIPFYPSPLTFQEAFGDFFANVEPGESSINWYSAVGGALGPGDVEDFFLFQSGSADSLALGFLDGPGGTVFFTQMPLTAVPLPAAAWLFLSALGGLVVVKRRRV